MTYTDLYDRETIGAFQALAEDHRTASPAARKPKFRVPYPPHRPAIERDARNALSPDSPLCPTCEERVETVTPGARCTNCGVTW